MGRSAGGRGDGTFRAGATSALPEPAGDLLIADTNGDGAPEVTACLPATGDLVTLAPAAPANGASPRAA